MTAKSILAMIALAAFSAHAGLDRYGNSLGEDEDSAAASPYALVMLIAIPILTFIAYSWLKKAKPDWSNAASFNAAFLGSMMAIVITILMLR